MQEQNRLDLSRTFESLSCQKGLVDCYHNLVSHLFGCINPYYSFSQPLYNYMQTYC